MNKKKIMDKIIKKADINGFINILDIEIIFNENTKLDHISRPLNSWQKFSKVIRYDLSNKKITGKKATEEIAKLWKTEYKNSGGFEIKEKIEIILDIYNDYEKKGYFTK
jgi:hypothetical protein